MYKNYRNVFSIVSKLVGSSFVIPFWHYIISFQFPEAFSFVLTVISSVMIAVIANFLFVDFPLLFLAFRRIMLPLSKYEGYWMYNLSVDDERCYSFFVIKYKFISSTFKYTGKDYNASGCKVCACDFNNIYQIDGSNGFSYTGTIYLEKTKMTNMGVFIYMENNNGNGYFSNIYEDHTTYGSYTAIRIKKPRSKEIDGENYDKFAYDYYLKHFRKTKSKVSL